MKNPKYSVGDIVKLPTQNPNDAFSSITNDFIICRIIDITEYCYSLESIHPKVNYDQDLEIKFENYLVSMKYTKSPLYKALNKND